MSEKEENNLNEKDNILLNDNENIDLSNNISNEKLKNDTNINHDIDSNIPLRVKQKKALVNYIMENIDNSNIPRKVWLLIIKSIHITTPGSCLLIFLFGSFEISMFFLFVLLCTLFLFLYFNGCFLTTIENKLEKDSVNIIDPYVYFLNDIPNNKNRYYYTLQLSVFYFIFTAVIFYVRHFNDNINLNSLLNYFQII